MSRIKNIGLVLSFVPGYSETFFKNKIRGLKDKGYSVTLLVDYKHKSHPKNNYDIAVAPNFHSNNLKSAYAFISAIIKTFLLNPIKSFRLYRLNKNDGYSTSKALKNVLINAHILERNFSWLHYGFGTLASGNENVARAIGARMGVSFRGFDLYLSPLKHPGCFDLLFTKQVKYHVLAKEMKDKLLLYGIATEKINIITPAIDTTFFKSNKIKPYKNKLRVLTVARLHWKKGLVYTLEALSLLHRRGIDFEYFIIGEGNELERLHFAAHQLGIKEKVQFLGKLAPVEVREQLNNSDIYIQYSIQEGFCNSVIEAQAMGLLCIVSNAEGLSENVLHNKTGWVVKKRQPDLLAAKILEVVKLSKEVKNNISNNAVERIQATFNLEQQQKKWQEFFD